MYSAALCSMAALHEARGQYDQVGVRGGGSLCDGCVCKVVVWVVMGGGGAGTMYSSV
jgi:hypothetical protein